MVSSTTGFVIFGVFAGVVVFTGILSVILRIIRGPRGGGPGGGMMFHRNAGMHMNHQPGLGAGIGAGTVMGVPAGAGGFGGGGACGGAVGGGVGGFGGGGGGGATGAGAC